MGNSVEEGVLFERFAIYIHLPLLDFHSDCANLTFSTSYFKMKKPFENWLSKVKNSSERYNPAISLLRNHLRGQASSVLIQVDFLV